MSTCQNAQQKQCIWKFRAETEIEAKDPHVQKSADSSWRGRKECRDGLLMSLREEFGNPFITYENLSPLCQWSPTSLTPETSFMKDDFSMQPRGRRGTFPFCLLLTSCCTAWFLTGHRQVTGIGPWPRGLGTPGLCNPVYHPQNLGSSHHWTDSQMNSRGQFVVLYQ